MAQKQNPLFFIFITLVLDVIGIGLIIPIIPSLIMELGHESVSGASKIGGWLTFTYAFMQFLFAPVLGALSDKYGRRPVLLFSLFGFGLDYLFLAFAPSLFWLFIGRILSGITGASITTASAYIADISNEQNRAKNFGIIGIAFGIGFIIGPTLGGMLGSFGPRVPFMVAAGLTFANWLYGYFILPESLSPENRRPFDWKRANALGSIRQMRKYTGMMGMLACYFLVYLASQAIHNTWSFFTIAQFNWDEKAIGISLGVVGIMVAIVQGGLIRVINPRIGNVNSVYLGFSMYMIGLFLFTFAKYPWQMYVFLIPYCLGGLSMPATQAIVSGQVSPQQQGELQGLLTSLVSITSIIGPPMMTNLFATFTSHSAIIYFPGAAFFVAGVIVLISLIIAYKSLQHRKRSKELS